jgi:hypothetical protein
MKTERPTKRIVTGVAVTTPVFLVVLLSIPAFAFPRARGGSPRDVREATSLETLEVRAAVMSRGIGKVEAYYDTHVAPVEKILAPYSEDQDFVREISVALAAEAESLDMDPRALASVLLVENPWLDPDIRSPVGAVGLMQVMPFHAGRWGCESRNLEDVRANICHGARIFAALLRQHGGNVDRALLSYNGCVRGTNTPDCHLYPGKVYTNAGRAAMQNWLDAPQGSGR